MIKVLDRPIKGIIEDGIYIVFFRYASIEKRDSMIIEVVDMQPSDDIVSLIENELDSSGTIKIEITGYLKLKE